MPQKELYAEYRTGYRRGRHMKKRHKRRRYRLRLCLMITLAIALLFTGVNAIGNILANAKDTFDTENDRPAVKSSSSAALAGDAQSLTSDEKLRIIQTDSVYPEAMVKFAQKYEQVIDYVYSYPELKDQAPEINLSAEASSETVPLLMQWDARWGYVPYGDGMIGYTGCGPTALSMVALYLTKDAQWTPLKVANLAEEKGYCTPENGSSWTLISEGSRSLGLKAKELPLHEPAIKNELKQGNPVIAVVGPGDFTFSGHFIVITSYNENSFRVNDCNSRENSEKSWSYDTLSGQIRNIWAMSAA